MVNFNNQQPNPTPASQPPAVPPQQQAQNQAATGLESQPNMAEDYTPHPSYQNTALPTPGLPLWKKLLYFVLVLAILGVSAFFLFYFNKGTLNITVEPGDSQVSVDGNNVARKQNYSLKLSAGEHTVNISLQDHVPYNNKIVIEAYKNQELKLELKGIPLVQKVSDEKFEFISASQDKKYILALGNSGKTFYKIPVNATQSNPDQKARAPLSISSIEAISEKKIGNVINVIWNPKSTLAILKVKNEKSKIGHTEVYKSDLTDGVVTTWLYDFKRYDLANQEITYLGNEIGDVVWTPNGDQIIYYDSDNRSLYQANPTNQNPTLVAKISKISNPQISISPDKKYLSLVPRLRTYSQNFVYLVDLYSKDTKQVIKEGNQRGAVFSPKSDKILYTTYTEDPVSSIKSILSVTNLTGEENLKTDIKTLIENISFIDDANFIYTNLSDPNGSEELKKYNIDSKQNNSYYFRSENVIHFNRFVALTETKKVYFLSENFMYYVDLIADDY